MTRQQNLLFKIAAKGNFMSNRSFAGGGSIIANRPASLGSRGSLIQTPGQRTTTGGTSWAKRSGADVAHAVAQRNSSLNGKTYSATESLRQRTQQQNKQPHDYIGNSVLTPTAVGKAHYDPKQKKMVTPTIRYLYDKSKVQQQLNRQQQELAARKQQLAKMKPTNQAQTRAYNAQARAIGQASASLAQTQNRFQQAQDAANTRMAANINRATGHNITGDQYAAMKHDVLPGTKGVRVNQIASGTTDADGRFRDATWDSTRGANQYVASRAANRATYNLDNWTKDRRGNATPLYTNAAKSAWTRPGQLNPNGTMRDTPQIGPGREAMGTFYSHIGKKPTNAWDIVNNDVAGWYVDKMNDRNIQDYRKYLQGWGRSKYPVGSRRYVGQLNYDPGARGEFLANGMNQLMSQRAYDPSFLSGRPGYIAPNYDPTSDPYYWQYQQTI